LTFEPIRQTHSDFFQTRKNNPCKECDSLDQVVASAYTSYDLFSPHGFKDSHIMGQFDEAAGHPALIRLLLTNTGKSITGNDVSDAEARSYTRDTLPGGVSAFSCKDS
jgi:hypothetical protein